MAKSLDGIKKLNPEDLKEYRKIVLNYIGEKDPDEASQEKSLSRVAALPKKIDGINLNKSSSAGSKKITGLKGSLTGPAVVSGGKKEELKEINSEEDFRLKEAIRRQEKEREKIKEEERQYRLKKQQAENELKVQEELRKKGIADRAKREALEKRRAEDVKISAEKMKLEEAENEKKDSSRKNFLLGEKKRQEEKNWLKLELEAVKRLAQEKRKVKRQKTRRRLKKKIKIKLREIHSIFKRNIAYIVSFSIICAAIIYLTFCIVVLRFRMDNIIISQALKFLSVPAVITNQGVVSYSDYQKIENEKFLSLSSSEKKNYLVKWKILNNLRKKYNLPADISADDIAIKFILDKDYNQVGLIRINKISELLNNSSEIDQLSKYADEYNGGAYYPAVDASKKFGPAVLKLAVNQVSQIIPRADGYYIVKRIADKRGQLGIKYIFIGAKTLEQYIKNELENASLLILAN